MWSSLYVISDSTGNLLLYADNLAMVEFVKNIHSMGLEMYQIKSVNSDDVMKAAVLLGNEIKNQRATQGWSLDVEDNEANIPESWLLGTTKNFWPNARDPPRTRLNNTTSQFSLPSTDDPCIIHKIKMDPSSPNANSIMWTHTSLEIKFKSNRSYFK